MNEWVLVKGRMEVVSSNSMFMGSWYQDLCARRPKTEISWLDGLSTGPPEIGASQDHFL